MIIIRIQACVRMFLAKRRVYALKQSVGMTPGMMHHHNNNQGGEDFENINVAVRIAYMKSPCLQYLCSLSLLTLIKLTHRIALRACVGNERTTWVL